MKESKFVLESERRFDSTGKDTGRSLAEKL